MKYPFSFENTETKCSIKASWKFGLNCRRTKKMGQNKGPF